MKSDFMKERCSLRQVRFLSPFFLALVATFVAGWPRDALAFVGGPGGNFLGDILCTLTSNMLPDVVGGSGSGFPGLINGVAYIAGGITIGSGLLLLVRHYDTRDTPLHQPIARLIGGAALLSFPGFIRWLLISLFVSPGPAGIASIPVCSGGYANSDAGVIPMVASSAPLDMLVQNLVVSIKDPLTLALSVLSMIIGAIYIFRGLVKASRYGTDPRVYSVTNILANLIVGAVLVTVGTSANVILATVFGANGMWASGLTWGTAVPLLPTSGFWALFNSSPWAIAAGFTPAQLIRFDMAVGAALAFFQLIGLIAFIRGWMILKSYAEQSSNASAAQGLTHVFGGALAINIYQILIILDNTFGTGFL